MTSKKILFVQLGRIGDLILMTPMFEMIKKSNPQNQVYLLAGKNNAHLAKRHPFIDTAFIYKKNVFHVIQLLRKLNKQNFDYWIDVKDHFSRESYYFAKYSNAHVKIGFNSKNKPVFDKSIPSNVEQLHLHAIERNVNTLSHLNLDLNEKAARPVLFVDEAAETKFQKFLDLHNIEQYYCINISAKTADRYWQQEKWIEFLKYIDQQHHTSIVISSPKDFKLAAEITRSNLNRAYFFKTTSIFDVFSIVKNATLTITPDTSVVHIAAAFDTPLLGLYENYEPNYVKFSPLSTINKMVMHPNSGAKISEISVELLIENYESMFKNFQFE